VPERNLNDRPLLMNKPMQDTTMKAADTAARHRWIACEQCDLLQREVDLAERSDAHCLRCDAVLYRGSRARLDTMIALALGCAVMFLVTNMFPIAALSTQGINVSTTLFGTVQVLTEQERPLVAVLMFVTTILVPALELSALLYMLLPLRFGRVPASLSAAFRLLLAAHPWSMLEVFLLGLLVTLVKLSELATIVPGIAFWSFCGMIVLFSWLSASFSTRDFWHWVEAAREGDRKAMP
jgi:paraquat-inducible protein A